MRGQRPIAAVSIHAKIQRRPMAKVLTEDQARRVASSIAKLPDLLGQDGYRVGFARRNLLGAVQQFPSM